MIVAGIDLGGKNVHIVIMKDDEVIARGQASTGINKTKVAESTYNDTLNNAGLTCKDVEHVTATGSSARRATFAHDIIPDATADARGVITLIPSARTIIDVGAEEGRAIKISPEGKVLDFAVNDKCASGTGAFVDTMARALELEVEEMAQISLKSTTSIPLNAQCAVFGESEVVSLIHAKVPKHDIARAVHDAIAGRISAITRIIGLEQDIVLIGGVALNTGLIDALTREIGMDIIVPDNPDYIGALGAAIIATGTDHRRLGVSGELEYLGKGVSYCATCDGAFFRGKKIAVVGGGNSAAIEAMFLKGFSDDVSLIHRRDQLRAEKIYAEQLKEKGINLILDSIVTEFNGGDVLENIVVENNKQGTSSVLNFDGVFISIGTIPRSELAKEIGAEFLETSAKTGENVDEAFNLLVQKIIE